MGNTYNQHNSINWSYLKRGRVALNQTKKKQKIQVFIPNTTEGILTSKSTIANLSKIKGKLYPPKNSIEVKVLNSTIDEYSLKKKKTNGTEECSVKKPPTNSDSKLKNTIPSQTKIKKIKYKLSKSLAS